jgi:cobalt-zinc-cadmium efflux system outer membrane protein
MVRTKIKISVICTLISLNLFSQQVFKDTISITLHQTDSIFIANNLSLLAEKCNVDAARAQIIQAKLFQNPVLSGSQGIYNTEYQTNGSQKWFDMSDKGETSLMLQKLFLLAGKRNKQIKLAELTADQEGHVYFDLIRTLKYSLHSIYYNIYYLNLNIKVYDEEIVSIKKLIQVVEEEYKKEFISKKDLLRLKSNLFSLENEKLNFSSQLIVSLSDFNMLLQTSNIFYLPRPAPIAYDNFNPESLKLQTLIDTAYVKRYDLKIAESDLNIKEMNLSYQKSLAVPDLTLAGGWDKNGGYIHNYNYLGVQIGLPIFNRNQGNIKSAEFMNEASKYKLQSAADQVKADVINAYASAIETDKLYRNFDNSFLTDLNEMKTEVLKNYRNRNISLTEFIDYYDAYKENAVQYNNLIYNRINSAENINFSVGTEIIK